MGSAEISKNKTRISRYFGDLVKSLWQPLNIYVNMIFRSAMSINICIEQLKFSELAQFKNVSIYYFFWWLPKIDIRTNVNFNIIKS